MCCLDGELPDVVRFTCFSRDFNYPTTSVVVGISTIRRSALEMKFALSVQGDCYSFIVSLTALLLGSHCMPRSLFGLSRRRATFLKSLLTRLVFLLDGFLDSLSCFFVHSEDYTDLIRQRTKRLKGTMIIVTPLHKGIRLSVDDPIHSCSVMVRRRGGANGEAWVMG